ncbi:acetate kinase [Chitinivibrio alkaliphilus]|uniref:acetate/propionate family kinase n=1 Tax=Chitinivibrio alkaliphilus TaxID=1505232 RepID=UPI00054D8D80
MLVINCGSSSLKYTFFNTEDMENSVDGQVDRIGTAVPMGLEYNAGKTEIERELEPGTHKDAFDAIIQILTSKEFGIISSPQEITAVGHRVVHGGDKFSHPTLITDDVLRGIEEVSSLAPLHNPVNLVGIHESMRVFPSAAQVAIFDTAFHQTIPPHAYLYGLPYEYYEKKRIRRYGFHGTSHYYVSLMAADYLKRSYTDLKLITCHLGNGGSVCAIEHGKSVDTSMGMTPAEGIIMGTRSGSIDPAVILHLMDSEKMTSGEVNQLINKQSGLLGLSGISNDMRDIEHAVKQGKNRAVLAYKTFCYSIKKYIGAYSATLGNVDALIFTGGIGLYNSFAREEVCKGLGALGMFIDQEKSKDLNGAKKVVDIATVDSPVRILVIPTNEELMIARETLSVICAD